MRKALQVVKPVSYPRGYETRHMVPGDVFHARSDRDHRMLLATKKVREVRDIADVPPPPPAIATKIAEAVAPPPVPASTGDDDIAALRSEYEARLGKRPFYGWDAVTLREKMASAES